LFDTESEELPFLSVCSQLIAAVSDKEFTKELKDNIIPRPAEVLAQADSARQTVQNAAQSATQNIILQIRLS